MTTTIFRRLVVLSALATTTCAQAQLSISIDPTGGNVTLTGSGTVPNFSAPIGITIYRGLLLGGVADDFAADPTPVSGRLVIAENPANPQSVSWDVTDWSADAGTLSLLDRRPGRNEFFGLDSMAGTLTLTGFSASQLSDLTSGLIIGVRPGGAQDAIGMWTVVPEPGPMAMLALGGAALLTARRRNR